VFEGVARRYLIAERLQRNELTVVAVAVAVVADVVADVGAVVVADVGAVD